MVLGPRARDRVVCIYTRIHVYTCINVYRYIRGYTYIYRRAHVYIYLSYRTSRIRQRPRFKRTESSRVPDPLVDRGTRPPRSAKIREFLFSLPRSLVSFLAAHRAKVDRVSRRSTTDHGERAFTPSRAARVSTTPNQPTTQPTQPTEPTNQPTNELTNQPTNQPINQPQGRPFPASAPISPLILLYRATTRQETEKRLPSRRYRRKTTRIFLLRSR